LHELLASLIRLLAREFGLKKKSAGGLRSVAFMIAGKISSWGRVLSFFAVAEVTLVVRALTPSREK
jgi:hypothetical protein